MKKNAFIAITLFLVFTNLVTLYKYYDQIETSQGLERGSKTYLNTLMWLDNQYSMCLKNSSNKH